MRWEDAQGLEGGADPPTGSRGPWSSGGTSSPGLTHTGPQAVRVALGFINPGDHRGAVSESQNSLKLATFESSGEGKWW